MTVRAEGVKRGNESIIISWMRREKNLPAEQLSITRGGLLPPAVSAKVEALERRLVVIWMDANRARCSKLRM